MAHQGGLVGNSDEFRQPERFSGQTERDGILLVTFLLLLKEKLLAVKGETRDTNPRT